MMWTKNTRGVLVPLAESAGSGVWCYSCVAKRAVAREVAAAARDPATGIIMGAEPLTLPGSSARACLLIHGWLGSRNDLGDLPARLNARGLTVRAMLLPGHGTTPYDLETVAAERFIEAVRWEYRALKAAHEDVTVIGFSIGGALATLLAAEEAPDRLVLVAPYFDVAYKPYYVLPAPVWNRLMRPFVRFVVRGDAFLGTTLREVKSRILAYRGVPTAAVAELLAIGARARAPETLAKVTAPVLLLHAPADHAAAYKAARTAFAQFGSAHKEFVTLPRSNHLIFWDRDAEEALRAIEAFLGAAGGEPAPRT